MALAWKAGWVYALTSSNLVSSASSIPAPNRAGIVVLEHCRLRAALKRPLAEAEVEKVALKGDVTGK